MTAAIDFLGMFASLTFGAGVIVAAEIYRGKEPDMGPRKQLYRDDKPSPNDALLRRLGWRIYSRPNRGEPIWIKRFVDGTYTSPTPQSVIMKQIEEAEKELK